MAHIDIHSLAMSIPSHYQHILTTIAGKGNSRMKWRMFSSVSAITIDEDWRNHFLCGDLTANSSCVPQVWSFGGVWYWQQSVRFFRNPFCMLLTLYSAHRSCLPLVVHVLKRYVASSTSTVWSTRDRVQRTLRTFVYYPSIALAMSVYSVWYSKITVIISHMPCLSLTLHSTTPVLALHHVWVFMCNTPVFVPSSIVTRVVIPPQLSLFATLGEWGMFAFCREGLSAMRVGVGCGGVGEGWVLNLWAHSSC